MTHQLDIYDPHTSCHEIRTCDVDDILAIFDEANDDEIITIEELT